MFEFFRKKQCLEHGKVVRYGSISAVTLLALTIAFPMSTSRAQEDAPLRVCFEQWVPYMTLDESVEKGESRSSVNGPAIEAVKAAGHVVGRELVFSAVPFARCVRDVSLGRFDMMLTVGMGVGGLISSDIPLAFWSIGAVVAKDDSISHFQDMSQFNGRRVLLTHPFEYPDTIMDSQMKWESLEWIKLNSGGGIQEYSRPLRMIETDRADVFFDDSFWAQRVIDESDTEVRLLYPPVHTEPTYIGFAHDSGELKQAFDRALSEVADSGLLDQIYEDGMGMTWRALERLTH